MNVIFTDFCGFEHAGKDAEWRQLKAVLHGVPLYVKQSDQAGKIGVLNFDPVGTNENIKRKFQRSIFPNP